MGVCVRVGAKQQLQSQQTRGGCTHLGRGDIDILLGRKLGLRHVLGGLSSDSRSRCHPPNIGKRAGGRGVGRAAEGRRRPGHRGRKCARNHGEQYYLAPGVTGAVVW